MGNVPPPSASEESPGSDGAVCSGHVATVGVWHVFDRLDDDMSGTITKSQFKRMMTQLCQERGYTCLTREHTMENDLDALWAVVDTSGRGSVGASEWSAMAAIVEKQRKRLLFRGTLVVRPKGAIVRETASRASTKRCTLSPGTVLREHRRTVLDDATVRVEVSWQPNGRGWISAKTVDAIGGPNDDAPESGRWTDWVNWLRAAEDAPERTVLHRNHSIELLYGNLRFLPDLDGERQLHLSHAIKELVKGTDLARGLRELEMRLEGDALTTDDRTMLREALLGPHGVAMRREQEAAVAHRLELAVRSCRLEHEPGEGESADEIERRRHMHRSRLARALHGAGLAPDPDPGSLSAELVRSVIIRIRTLSGLQLFMLSHWASLDEMLIQPECSAWLQARDSGALATASPTGRPPLATARAALLTCVPVAIRSVATTGGEHHRRATIRAELVERYARISAKHLAADIAAVQRVWAVSDLHVDFGDNQARVESWVAHPDDALVVAGDVARDLSLFEEVMIVLVAKYKYVFFCPGNHDLWVFNADHESSLDKFFELLCVCDKLGVITYPVHVGDSGLFVVPLFSWYCPDFVTTDNRSRDKISSFDRFCLWPDFLAAEDDSNNADNASKAKGCAIVIDGVECSTSSIDPGIAAFFRRLNRPAIDAVKSKIAERHAPALCLSFSHFVPHRTLFEGLGGVNFLGGVMGDAAIMDDIKAIKSTVHIFGHSHLNTDTIVDGVRYVQNSLGNESPNRPNATQPILVWDSNFAAPVS